MSNVVTDHSIPRVVVAGTGSGCGKTTITCAILQAFMNRGLKTGAFKCGPDYIDPMFHTRIIGHASYNLDAFFCEEDTLRYLLSLHGSCNDINIIEGVMGFYDGAGLDTDLASTYDVAVKTKSPVVLVIGAKGASASVLAVLQGFLTWRTDAPIRGVILNQCTAMTYQVLARQMETVFQGRVKPLGYMPAMPDCSLESRHLGLVTAEEVTDLMEKLQILAAQAEKSIDLEGILQLAQAADPVPSHLPRCLQPYFCEVPKSCMQSLRSGEGEVPAASNQLPQAGGGDVAASDFEKGRGGPVRIAVARDKAFCFYYEDNLELLQQLGAELVPFSPLTDRSLPEAVQGLYLGGGYPELYPEALSGNISMRSSIQKALQHGLPCIAECGGFMYLTESICAEVSEEEMVSETAEGSCGHLTGSKKMKSYPMAGVIKGSSFNTGKLSRFGYVTLKASRDNMLCKKGGQIRAHEFHYWDSDHNGNAFTASKRSGKSWDCVHTSESMYAGYPHFHFYAEPSFAVNFIAACRKYARSQEP